jgi:branched-chain amino acid transport system ATP-binding protein
VSLLEAVGVTKTFAGITALDHVDLDVKQGEIVGLIGPNGAGKTTFFNCLLGILKPDDGRVSFDGKDLTRIATHRRARLGIGRTFQRIELFAGMTPRDHFLVAERVRNGRGALWKDVLGLGRASSDENSRVDAMLELLGLNAVADRPIESLSLGVGRLVEIGRALMTEPKLVLLDEPSSGLDRHETETLGAQLRAVQHERGFAILLVEHDVEFVRSLVERVFVLDFGTLIASGLTDEVFADASDGRRCRAAARRRSAPGAPQRRCRVRALSRGVRRVVRVAARARARAARLQWRGQDHDRAGLFGPRRADRRAGVVRG